MPSPVGHALAGLGVHILSCRKREDVVDAERMTLTVGAALAPDVDLLFRFVDGTNHHNHETHSLGFALLAALASALVLALLRRPRPIPRSAAVGVAWASHVLLDYLNRDTHPPIGIMALWPASDRYFKFPWALFLDIGRTLEWQTLFHNLLAAAWEAIVLTPLLWLAWKWRRRRLE